MKFRALLLLLSSLSAVGCSCSEPSDPDGGGSDAGNTDAPTAFDAGFDATLADAPIGSDTSTEDAPADAPTDANVASDDAPVISDDAGGCEYTALDEVIVECEGMPTFVSRVGVFPPSDACPEYWVVGSRPTHYESAEQAIASESCDAGCEWHFSMSVTRLYCGRRTGYEVLRADGEGCEDLYRFDDGYYPSVEAYDETHPCPD